MDLTMVILSAIGSAIIAVGSLFAWGIKITLPKFLESFEERNKILFSIYQKTSESFAKLPETILAFEKSMLNVESRLTSEIDTAKDELLQAVYDTRFKDLADRISVTGKDPAQSTRFPKNHTESSCG